jgi:hypothetical protein
MTMGTPQFNPYEPPQATAQWQADPARLFPALPESRWGEIEVSVASFYRGWWKRRLCLTGSIEANIEYDPVGDGERVFVNGGLVVKTSGWSWSAVQPHIGFHLEALGFAIPASIDVKASIFFLRTYAFRLVVAGKIIYEE